MSQQPKRSFWVIVKYWIFIIAVLAILFELFASMVLFRKYGTEKLAIVQFAAKFIDNSPELSLYHKMHELARPDSTPETCRQIADEIWDANKYSYEPWLMFKVADFKSKYVNVNGFQRTSIPSEIISAGSGDTIDIHFFGGSTMYGWNLSDAETIPSQLLTICRERLKTKKSIRIRNFGIPYYYSKQELMLFSKMVFEGARPDIVVFMDGLNDFYPSRMLYFDRPHFTYAMQQVFDDKMFMRSKRTIADTSEQYHRDLPNVPSKEYYQALHDKYIVNIRGASTMAAGIGAKSYFFCQPVPFFNYPNRSKDPIAFKIDYDRYNYIYPLLRSFTDTAINFTYLGDMLADETGLPFIDQVHYTPAFCRKIAEEMYARIEPALN